MERSDDPHRQRYAGEVLEWHRNTEENQRGDSLNDRETTQCVDETHGRHMARDHTSVKSVLACEDHRLRARPHTQFVVDARHVIADCLFRNRQSLADLRITESLGDQPEDLPLSWRERRERIVTVTAGGTAEEVEHCILKTTPGRFVFEEDVILRRQLDKLRTANR